MKIKINKKSQAGSGFSWFVGFIIIFFIMFLFTSASLISSKTKKVPAVGVEITESNLILTKQLVSFLNTEVEEKKTVKELIIFMVEPYLNEGFLSEAKISDINSLYKRLPILNKELLLKYGINENELDKKNKEIIKKFNGIFNEPCKDYIIKFPLGYLYKRQGEELAKVSGDYISLLNKEYLLLFNSANMKILYDKYFIEIEYKERFFC